MTINLGKKLVAVADKMHVKFYEAEGVKITKALDNIDIEIVAYGPGLGMLTEKSSVMDRVSSLSLQEVSFSACGNTMQTIEKKTGVAPKLIEGVGTVQAGVARIMELQEQGYSYIRP